MSEFDRQTGQQEVRTPGHDEPPDPEKDHHIDDSSRWGHDTSLNQSSVQEEFPRPNGHTAEKPQVYIDKARAMASEYGAKAQERLDAGRERAAAGMKRGAGLVRDGSSQVSGLSADAGGKVAGGMESVADYLDRHDTNAMWDGIESYTRKHPGRTLVGAVIGGFALGRVLG